MSSTAIPRGVRNNNPGNIDYNKANDWQGQLGLEERTTGARFARFDSPENGIRALAKLLLNYRGKPGTPNVGQEGIDTVQEIINRWAPGHENNTAAYVAAVSKSIGKRSVDSLNLRDPDLLLGLVSAIIVHENGSMPYATAVVREGVRRALA